MIVHSLIVLACILGIGVFSHWVAHGTEAIGKAFGMNQGVRGATLDAVSSSFPELCTVVAALIAGSFDAGLGTICGSALFNILVIPGAAAVVAGNLRVNPITISRDGMYYMMVVILLLGALMLGTSVPDAPGFRHLPAWVGAVAIVLYLGYVLNLAKASKKSDEVVEKIPMDRPVKTMVMLIAGIVGVGISCHFLVHSGLAIAAHLGMSEAILGVTVLAAATSIPDTLISVLAAKRGEADAAVANAFGSNSFDILICLGLPIALSGGLDVNWEDNQTVIWALILSTIAAIQFLMSDWELKRGEAWVMIIGWVAFCGAAFAGMI